jgi:orotidine-5'-phosphate decarboxylase
LAIVKSKLLKQLYHNYPNFLKKDLEKFTDIILNEIKRALRKGDGVELRNFGTFRVKTQKASIRRNPKTGEKVAVPEKKVISWKMSKEMFKKINTKKLKIIPKFGLQFFYSKNGRNFLEKYKSDFWLDLKINDIPQTALSAVESLKDLKKCKYITVHANGGLDMLKAIKKKAKKINKNLKVLGVTILTSLNNKSLKEIGHTKTVEQLVFKQTIVVKKSGCDGIVCSAKEAKMIRKKYKKFLIITPGIRMPGDNLNDQARVMTPKDAFKNKVSGIVIGRSITKGNIQNNINKLIDHLNG